MVYEDIAKIYQTIVSNIAAPHWGCVSVPLVVVWSSLIPKQKLVCVKLQSWMFFLGGFGTPSNSLKLGQLFDSVLI